MLGGEWEGETWPPKVMPSELACCGMMRWVVCAEVAPGATATAPPSRRICRAQDLPINPLCCCTQRSRVLAARSGDISCLPGRVVGAPTAAHVDATTVTSCAFDVEGDRALGKGKKANC